MGCNNVMALTTEIVMSQLTMELAMGMSLAVAIALDMMMSISYCVLHSTTINIRMQGFWMRNGGGLFILEVRILINDWVEMEGCLILYFIIV